MRSAGRSPMLRWLLFAVVASGIVLMHHVPAGHDVDSASHPAATSISAPAIDTAPVANPMPDASAMGAMLHECLAVISLFASTALLMLLFLVVTLEWARPPSRSAAGAWARAPDRPPGWGGRTILASVCVLRL